MRIDSCKKNFQNRSAAQIFWKFFFDSDENRISKWRELLVVSALLSFQAVFLLGQDYDGHVAFLS